VQQGATTGRTGEREVTVERLEASVATAAGRSTSVVSVLGDGRLAMDEEWDWESEPGSGTSRVVEIAGTG
jgi:hypothetical protein